MIKNLPCLLAEICLIIIVSAAAGIFWNRALLSEAWHGELTQTATSPPLREELPMPIGLVQVRQMVEANQALIVDARSASSFREGHIQGAIPLPLEELRKDASLPLKAKLPKKATIIVYCNGFSCHDSMDLGKILIAAGYASVYVFEGGFPQWHDAGYPIAQGAP
jgi:rhodanese-related sulfurtransferase